MNVNSMPVCVGVVAITIIALCTPATSIVPGLGYYPIKFGKDDHSQDQVIAKCIKLLEQKFDCTVSISNASEYCNVTIQAEQGITDVEIDLIHRFPDKKFLLVWHEMSEKFNLFSRNMYAINFNNCKITNHLVFPRNHFDWRNLEKLIFYENSFETISEIIPIDYPKRHRKIISTTFNADGHAIKIVAITPGTTTPQPQADKIKDIVTFSPPSTESSTLLVKT